MPIGVHRNIPLAVALPLALSLLLVQPSAADVTVEERLRVEGPGMMRFLNMTGRTVTSVSGLRARTDSELEMDSRLMRMAAGGGRGAEIVRLDRGVVYELDMRRSTYTETSLAEQREALAEAMEEMRGAQRSQQQGVIGIDEGQCDWSEPVSSVERGGEMAEIAGLQAERVSFVTRQTCTDRQSGQICEYRLSVDQWLTRDENAASGLVELQEYFQEYAAQLGFDTAASRGFSERSASLFGGYEGLWGELTAFAAELDGFPLRSRMGLAIGGPQCETVQQAQEAMPGVGEAIGGAVGGAIGGLLGRQRDDRRGASREAEAPRSGELIEFMSIENETISISRASVDPSVFEVPDDFRPAR